MERRAGWIQNGFGKLTAPDGESAEVYYVLGPIEENIGGKHTDQIWMHRFDVREVDFRAHSDLEDRFKGKGVPLALTAKDGTPVATISWRSGHWFTD